MLFWTGSQIADWYMKVGPKARVAPMPMHPRERLAYSPIEGRPLLKFPKGVRLVIWPVLALEEWDMSPPHGAHGDFAAAGPADAARPSELELA